VSAKNFICFRYDDDDDDDDDDGRRQISRRGLDDVARYGRSSLYASGDYRVDSVGVDMMDLWPRCPPMRADYFCLSRIRTEGGSPFATVTASALIYTRILHFFSFFQFLHSAPGHVPSGSWIPREAGLTGVTDHVSTISIISMNHQTPWDSDRRSRYQCPCTSNKQK